MRNFVLHPRTITLMSVFYTKKKQSKYLSSGETGSSCIFALAKQTKSCDIQATRIRQLIVL